MSTDAVTDDVTQREASAHLRKVFCLLILQKKKIRKGKGGPAEARRGAVSVSWEDPRVDVPLPGGEGENVGGESGRSGCGRLEERCRSGKGAGGRSNVPRR